MQMLSKKIPVIPISKTCFVVPSVSTYSETYLMIYWRDCLENLLILILLGVGLMAFLVTRSTNYNVTIREI